MLTDLGRILRKIRIDRGEILKNMADLFGVTASFLSAVENGKRAVPKTWEQKILECYELDESQKQELHKAIINATEVINIDISNTSFENKEIAFAFARKVADLSEEKLQKIKKILGGD